MKTTFFVDRCTWLRGSSNNSYLLDNNGNRCCLGFVCTQLSIKDYDMELEAEPFDSSNNTVLIPILLDENHNNNILSRRAMIINDDGTINDHVREVKLERLFEEYGLRINFFSS